MPFQHVQYTQEVGGNPDYYEEYTLTNLYVERALNGNFTTLTITNDSTSEDCQFSWDGATLAGEVKAGESLTINTKGLSSIYIKGSVGTDTIRLWGYAVVGRTGKPDDAGNTASATNTKATIGATSSAILSANAARIQAIIVNDGGEDVYLSFSGTAVMNEGILLVPGGSITESNYTGAITGICASGGLNVTVCEL